MKISATSKYSGQPPFGALAVVRYRYNPDQGVTDVTVLPHLVLHSPDGFAWGYPGSGAAELARCILIDLVGTRLGDLLHQDFKRDVITPLRMDRGWTLTRDAILTYVRNKAADRGIPLDEDDDTVCRDAAGHIFGAVCPTCGQAG